MGESRFERDTIEEIETMFPGCVIIKNYAGYRQGIPDRLILFGDKWAMLEFKDAADADHQPNQDYYVELFDKMSFAAFIYPENKDEVLYALQQAFGISRLPRLSKPKQVSLGKLRSR